MTEYDSVRTRIKEALNVNPPQFCSLLDFNLSSLVEYLGLIFNFSDKPDGLSAGKESLFDHLKIMENYFEVLMNYPDFLDLAKRVFPEKTYDFLLLLVYLHDYSRFIFNGPLPLTYVDWVSGGLLRKIVLNQMFPNNPEITQKILNCFHSIDWIIGKKTLPQNNNELTDEQKLGLVLKVIDTLGKREKSGQLRDPNEFFSENGGYSRWLDFQIKNQRFPLKIGPNQFIDAQTYAENDIALTKRGIRLIEDLTKEKFATIRNKVQELCNS